MAREQDDVMAGERARTMAEPADVSVEILDPTNPQQGRLDPSPGNSEVDETSLDPTDARHPRDAA